MHEFRTRLRRRKRGLSCAFHIDGLIERIVVWEGNTRKMEKEIGVSGNTLKGARVGEIALYDFHAIAKINTRRIADQRGNVKVLIE